MNIQERYTLRESKSGSRKIYRRKLSSNCHFLYPNSGRCCVSHFASKIRGVTQQQLVYFCCRLKFETHPAVPTNVGVLVLIFVNMNLWKLEPSNTRSEILQFRRGKEVFPILKFCLLWRHEFPLFAQEFNFKHALPVL